MAAYYGLLFSVLLSCGLFSLTTAQTACTAPPIITNAYTNASSFTDGSIVNYTCNYGYQAIGSTQYVCREGVWSHGGAPLRCAAIVCLRPPTISRGSFRSLSGSSYTVGTVVTYNCYSGYFINASSADITCLSSGSWSDPIPTCVKKDCGTPLDLAGGNVSFTATDYYSPAVYSCYPGYDIYSNGFPSRSGTVTVRCLSSGSWGLLPICKPKDCGIPSNIAHGIKKSSGNYKYEDTVTYDCVFGYELRGNSTGSVTCGAEGKWSLLPECQKVECKKPPPVKNASRTTHGKYYFGNSTIYECSKGFEMTGSAVAYCQADKEWTQLPRCSLVDCRTPPFIHFGTHQWTTTTYNSTATYSCDKYYRLIGVHEIYCEASGKWTNSPTCELPKGQTTPTLVTPQAQVAESSDSNSDSDSDSSALTGLAIACALFGVITLLCLIILIYKIFFAGKSAENLFSYASYKNGDDVINANL